MNPFTSSDSPGQHIEEPCDATEDVTFVRDRFWRPLTVFQGDPSAPFKRHDYTYVMTNRDVQGLDPLVEEQVWDSDGLDNALVREYDAAGRQSRLFCESLDSRSHLSYLNSMLPMTASPIDRNALGDGGGVLASIESESVLEHGTDNESGRWRGGGSRAGMRFVGETRVMALGDVAGEYRYGPYGQTRTATETGIANPFRFSTKFLETAFSSENETLSFGGGLDLYDYGFRWYHAGLGRWTARDPIGEAGGVNLYRFVGNDALVGIDIYGYWRRGNTISTMWREDSWDANRALHGIAYAECGDTLGRLAQLITGRASDWRLLGIPERVRCNQAVDVSPLLRALRSRMQDNVVSATTRFRAAFSISGRVSAFPGLMGSDVINQFFDPGNLDGSRVESECRYAAQIVMAKGLVDTITAKTFNELNYSFRMLAMPRGDGSAITPYIIRHRISLSELWKGDWTYFRNAEGYSDPANNNAWQGENVINVSENGVSIPLFWGFTGAVEDSTHPGQFTFGIVLTEDGWKTKLRNSWTSADGSQRTAEPTWLGFGDFLNVALIASEVFDHRKGTLR